MFLSNTLSNKKHLSRQALYPRRERRGFTAWSGKVPSIYKIEATQMGTQC